MKRDYATGEKEYILFFIGNEVEHTPAFGDRTLFVVGIQPIDLIKRMLNKYDCYHIYLGANQSFNLGDNSINSHISESWDNLIRAVLNLNILTTLDFDVKYVEWVCKNGYAENNLFISQISVKIPYLQQLGYNAVLKIDDKDFKASNPGVWCHTLHDLTSHESFTSWSKYSKDEII
jgi:hypothetical protein